MPLVGGLRLRVWYQLYWKRRIQTPHLPLENSLTLGVLFGQKASRNEDKHQMVRDNDSVDRPVLRLNAKGRCPTRETWTTISLMFTKSWNSSNFSLLLNLQGGELFPGTPPLLEQIDASLVTFNDELISWQNSSFYGQKISQGLGSSKSLDETNQIKSQTRNEPESKKQHWQN